jgi:hypothetical protein
VLSERISVYMMLGQRPRIDWYRTLSWTVATYWNLPDVPFANCFTNHSCGPCRYVRILPPLPSIELAPLCGTAMDTGDRLLGNVTQSSTSGAPLYSGDRKTDCHPLPSLEAAGQQGQNRVKNPEHTGQA